MSFFQNNVLRKYADNVDKELIAAKYQQYKEYFLNPVIQENIQSSKEEQFQEGFLRELFVKILGYTLNPSPNFNLITEQKNETNSKKADGAILVNDSVVGVIELKDHKTTDLSKIVPQAFGYKNQNKNAIYVIISNFEKLRFYIDNSVDCIEFDLFHLKETDFTTLWLCLAYENISTNLPKKIKTESVSNEDSITNALYKDYSNFKRVLFADILQKNPCETVEEKVLLFKKTQKLLDRFLFIFFAEDSGLLAPNTMLRIISDWEKLKDLDEYQPLYNRIKKYFGWLNDGYKGKDFEVFAYNGGLFKTDEVLDNLIISDEILAIHTKKLAEYDYKSEVDVNILGHIFENSLTEIEEVTNELQNGVQANTSKRKKDGVFYTPQYITKYIVENTVGKLCTEKKAELGIQEEEYFADKNRQKATKTALKEKLDKYRDWLLQLTICDPACGSGAFLNAALDFLIAEHRLVDEMEAKVFGEGLVFSYYANSILENNLYGVDINEESVEIAKLSLWLRTAQPHRKLNSLSNNIKCGNSLISDSAIAGEKAFDWQKEFSTVFAKGGFDAIITNPPYVFDREKFTETEKEFYVKNYTSAKYQVNLYILFIEKVQKLLKGNGVCGVIVPNSWLMVYSGEDLRKYLYENVSLEKIANLSGKSFSDANVETVILIDKNSKPNEITELEIYKNDEGEKTFEFSHKLKQCDFGKNKGFEFTVFKTAENTTLIEKLKENTLELDVVASVKAGLQAYEKGKGNPKQTEEDVKIRPFDYTYKFDEETYKYLDGSNVLRYGINWSGLWLKYGNHLAAPRTFDLFSGEKVIIREITGKYPKCVNATYSNEIYLYNRSNIAVVKRDANYSLKYILAILNSSLMSFYFKKNTAKSERKLFPKIILNDLRLFPIKKATLNEQTPFIELADKMLCLNVDLQQKRNRFFKRMSENLGEIKITGALEKFDELDFKAFVLELKKQKIKLTLVQQDEWEEYFTQYKQDCKEISSQIAKTDAEIDQMVYELYGLTEEEIKIVEGR